MGKITLLFRDNNCRLTVRKSFTGRWLVQGLEGVWRQLFFPVSDNYFSRRRQLQTC